MKKALQSVLVAALLLVSTASPGMAGIEPSPWHIDIIFIQSQIFEIGQTLDLPEEVRDSLVQIDLRLASFDQDPQQNPWITPELVTQGLRVIGHVSEILINPQPEPPGLPQEYAVQLVGVIDGISQILINPQPEPPGYIAQGLSVLDRISWVLFDPQPEPPGFSPDLYGPSIDVMYQVAGVMERTLLNGFDGTIPGLNALEQLSGHLVVAVVEQQPHRAAAQVNAMWRIAGQYAGF